MGTLCSLLCPCVTIGDPVSSASADETPLLAPNEEEGKLESYEVLGKLGEGAYAVVKEVRHRATGQRYALKLIVKARSDEQDVARELSVLKRVGTHRNIVSLVESFDLERTFALVLEFAGGGEVFQRMASRGQYSERDAMALVAQVGSALQHIHACSVSHRDLKPENLLLESSAEDAPVKVCDFGIAAFGVTPAALVSDDILGATSAPIEGTVRYMAPEVLRGEAHGTEVDMWALGVLLYILLSGRHPFDLGGSSSDGKVMERVLGGQWGMAGEPAEFFGVWDHVSSDARQTVRALLEPDPEARIDAAGLLAMPWMRGRAPLKRLPDSDKNLLRFNSTRSLLAARFVSKLQRMRGGKVVGGIMKAPKQ